MRNMNRISILGNLYYARNYCQYLFSGTNPCSINNGGCQDICLFNGKFTSCACEYGDLNADKKSCSESSAFLLYSRISHLESIHITNASNLNPPMKPIKPQDENIVALAFDYESKLIFYSDLQKGSINKVNFDGEGQEVVLSHVGGIEGLVFEHTQKHLYWTNNVDKSINRLSLVKGHNVKVEKVIFLHLEDKPRGIDVDSCQGQLYFTNWNSQRPSIQRSWFSGYGLESVITTKIRMPNAIVIDDQERKMYWADARLDKIELVFLDNMDRIVMTKANPQHPFGLAIHGNHLFYTDWIQHAVIRVSKYTGEDMTMLRTEIPRPMAIVAIANQSLTCQANPCSQLNGGCEDICKVNQKGQAECHCYPGRFLIDAQGKRCAYTRLHCENENDFQCSQSLNDKPICIPYNLTCDGRPHCPDESDENIRYCAVRRCKKGFFQCTNNKCVLEEHKCNGQDECGDYRYVETKF